MVIGAGLPDPADAERIAELCKAVLPEGTPVELRPRPSHSDMEQLVATGLTKAQAKMQLGPWGTVMYMDNLARSMMMAASPDEE